MKDERWGVGKSTLHWKRRRWGRCGREVGTRAFHFVFGDGAGVEAQLGGIHLDLHLLRGRARPVHVLFPRFKKKIRIKLHTKK
jgi:hypothetical protein